MSFNFAKRLWPSRTTRRSNRRPRPTRLNLEQLEDRLVPSTADPSLVPPSGYSVPPNQSAPPNWAPEAGAGYGFAPDQIRQAYGFNNITFHGSDNNTSIKGDGAGQTIAIIEPAIDPNVVGDANYFSAAYALPQFNTTNGPTLQQVKLSIDGISPENYPTGSASGEAALDVEWAHAMAPQANILVVDAPVQNIQVNTKDGSISWNDSTPLYQAAHWAASLPGGGWNNSGTVHIVSMSFGGNSSYPLPEWEYDSSGFSEGGSVTFVASAGDQGEFTYPASSPNVLGVGGTTLTVDASGNYVSESVWNEGVDAEGNVVGSGSGADPDYSSPYNPSKSGPDVAYNAGPSSPNGPGAYAVYDTYAPDNSLLYDPGHPGWFMDAGTSAGAPQWAAIIAIADQGRVLGGYTSLDTATTRDLLHGMPSFDFHGPQTMVNNPNYTGNPAAAVGLGSPYADRVVYGLALYYDLQGNNLLMAQTGQAITKPIATFQDYTDYGAYLNAPTSGGCGGQVVNLGNGQYEVLAIGTFNSPGRQSLSVELTGIDGFVQTTTSTVNVGTWTQNQLYVESLYKTFLNRYADSAGLTYWSGVASQNPYAAAYGADHNTEYYGDVINQMFEAILNRPADSGALTYYEGQMNGSTTEQQILIALLSSNEFWDDNGANNAGFLNALYQDVLKRPADANGLEYWVGQLQSGVSRATVASAFVYNNEFETDEVNALYGTQGTPTYSFLPDLFNRNADTSGLDYWVSQLNSGVNILTMEAIIASSSEFYNNAQKL